MKRNDFMKNAVIMTITAILLRAIGIFFRIYLSNRIGAEGMGLYQLVFSIYVLASTFASAGISTAVARLITDELVCGTVRSVKRILRRSVSMSIAIGIVSALLLYFIAEPICEYCLKDLRALPSLQILGISLPFMGTSSCLRGYYMARRKSACPSIAQIAEQLVRIFVITVLLQHIGGRDITYTCLAVIAGDCLAEIVSCIFITIGYLIDQRKLSVVSQALVNCTRDKHGILYRIAAIAVPITAGRYLNSGLRTVENILVPNKLSAHSGSTTLALSQFGMLKGMVLPLLFFPSSFLGSLATLLIPELSEAQTLGQKNKVSRAVINVLRLTLWISIWLSGLFTVYAYDLGTVLYHSEEVGFLLRVLAPLVPVMYLESIVEGMLKGLNQQISSLWYGVIDSASRIALIVVLVPIKGMEGFLFIMLLSNLLTSSLRLHRLLKVTGVAMRWGQWVLKPVLAVSLASAITTLFTRIVTFNGVPIILKMLCGSICITGLYAGISLLLGMWKWEDIRSFTVRRNKQELELPTHF